MVYVASCVNVCKDVDRLNSNLEHGRGRQDPVAQLLHHLINGRPQHVHHHRQAPVRLEEGAHNFWDARDGPQSFEHLGFLFQKIVLVDLMCLFAEACVAEALVHFSKRA